MSFYMNVQSMLNDFGTDIKVWGANKPHEGNEEPTSGSSANNGKLSMLDPKLADERHEPVLPINSMTSQLAQILAGGVQTNADLLWLSSGKYYVNTVVYVPTQGGYFHVTNFSNYQDYSDLIIYELKGDDEHQYQYDGNTQGSTFSDIYS